MTAALLSKAQQGNQDAREQLLRENAGLIWSIVRRFYGRGTEPEAMPAAFLRSTLPGGCLVMKENDLSL